MIFIVPAPVFSYPDRDPVSWADQRASNTDRDVAADILCAAAADGRLTLAELDERLEDVLSARTLCELARLISDLPGSRFSAPVQAAAHQAASPPGRPQPPAETSWSLLQSLVAPAASQYTCRAPG
jgi:uncharacterized protein DUF1707